MDGEAQQAGPASALAWRAVGSPEANSGPRQLALAATRGAGHHAGTGSALPGSGVDALMAGSAIVTAADLGLGDALPSLAADAREAARRVGAYVDGVWASELGLVTESPLLELLVADAAALQPPPGPEAALGAALARALEDGLVRGRVDVSLLRDAAGPLEDLLAALPGWGDGLLPGLTFDPDVLQLARASWRFLHVTHGSWFAARNRALGGEPRAVLQHPVDTWARHLADRASGVVARVHVQRSLEGSEEDISELVKQHFSWAADADREGFADWLDSRITAPVQGVLEVVDPAASQLAVRMAAHLPELEDEDDVSDAVDAVAAYLEAWLLTDAGLLARLHRELHLASDTWAWRRVALEGHASDWATADVAAAAHTGAGTLGVADVAGVEKEPA